MIGEQNQSRFFVDFDFDDFRRLAVDDPDLFEIKRKNIIQQLLRVHDKKDCQQAKRLQSRIDLERRRHKSAMGACIKINQMMMDHFHLKFRPALNDVQSHTLL